MKVKKLVLIFSVSAAIVALTVYYVVRINQAAEDFQERVTLPAFSYTQFNGNPYTPDSLNPGKPLVIMLFDPDCEHCVEEIGVIQESFAAFAGIQLLMVSPADRSRVIPYIKEQGLDQLPGIVPLFTEPDAFLEDFGTLKMPSMYFYGIDNRLKKELHGSISKEKLIAALELIRPA